MARHKHLKNIDIDEELDDDDSDRDYFGKSVEDDPPSFRARPQPTLPPTLIPAVEQLKVAAVVKVKRPTSKSPGRMTPNVSSHQLSQLDVALNTTPVHRPRRRDEGDKKTINLTIVGHVDAGKSTLMGHILHLTGVVDEKTINRYKQQAARMGKASFAYAWILDETEEERTRGVTMDVAHAAFETPNRRFHVLDAPGHRDFVPNMISGASQADAALLVVNVSRGEFETGFDQGGQTREHALLLRSVGVQELVVAINKMDSVEWSQERYDEVVEGLRSFLRKQAGFPHVHLVPVSGLSGENLQSLPLSSHPLMQWYKGPCLVDVLDSLEPPVDADERPLRLIINDVHKTAANSVTLSGKIETGHIESGEKLFVMPKADAATVKSVGPADVGAGAASHQQAVTSGGIGFAGDQVVVTLAGTFDAASVNVGNVLCRGGTELCVPIRTFIARIILFDDALPILKGSRAEVFAHAIRELCIVTKLLSINNRQTGERLKENPRVIAKGMSAVVEIVTDAPICVEVYSTCKQLGRISLRIHGRTIAAGIVESIPKLH